MRQTYPGWDVNTEALVSAEIDQNPVIAEMVSRAVESQDPTNVVMALSGSLAAVQSRQQAQSEAAQQTLTAMKQNAQTMTGSWAGLAQQSSNAEWDAIRAAVPDRYAG